MSEEDTSWKMYGNWLLIFDEQWITLKMLVLSRVQHLSQSFHEAIVVIPVTYWQSIYWSGEYVQNMFGV